MIFWGELLYEDQAVDAKVFELVKTGETLYKFQEKLNKQANDNGFEYEIDGFKGWVVNCPIGNSRLFGEKYDEYDFVCKYAYDGSIDKWRYTFYSKKDSEFDCADVCQKDFNGGGHHGAAGGWLEYNIFDKNHM
jgi:oligoribonuclease NrnB/cAMP/cGMP phosphodiesterase (DHH superfamily)